MSDQQWGFGNGDLKSWLTTKLDDGTPIELLHGEHPHSRRDDTRYARFPNGKIEGFDGHQILTRIELREFNYLKTSGLSGNEVRRGGQFQIRLNDRLVWAEFFREMAYGLQKASSRMAALLDSPLRLWEEKEPQVGRKIFYREVPAVIEGFDCDEHESAGNRLYLRAENGVFPKALWDENDEFISSTVVTDTLSPHIWWWRS